MQHCAKCIPLIKHINLYIYTPGDIANMHACALHIMYDGVASTFPGIKSLHNYEY